MRFSPARFISLAALVPALVLLVVVPGCAKQGEGERCGEELGSASDVCGDGLTCTQGQGLIGGTGAGNRCCRTDNTVTDSRCDPSGTTPSDNSDGAAGASDGGN